MGPNQFRNRNMPRKKINPDSTTAPGPTSEAARTEASAIESGETQAAPPPAKGRRKGALSLLSKVVESVATALGGQQEAPKKRQPKAKVAATAAATSPSEWTADLDLPMPSWRSAAKATVMEARPADAPQSTSEEEGTGRRKRRRRGRGQRDPEAAETTQSTDPAPEREAAPAPGVALPMRPEAPVVPVKPMIHIPDHAPQVVMRNGVPTLVREGRVYPPIFFFGNASTEKRAATVLDEAKTAGEAGIHVHSVLIDLEVETRAVDAAVSLAAYMLAKLVEVDPEAQVVFRVTFGSPDGWQHRFNDAKFFSYDGSPAEPSICDDEYWGVARDCLVTFIKKVQLLEQGAHILGLHLDRGEWFFSSDWGYDTSNAAKRKFRDWARTRYSNDEVALRASWFDGSARFENLQVPAFQPEGAEGDHFVRSSRKQRKFVDFHLFLSDATVARIQELAYAAKEASEGMFLVGVSYGYTFEWTHPSSCHLSLGKLLRTPEIDFVAGPPNYRTREPGGAAPFPGPIDSFALNGKLFVSEEDYKTAIGSRNEPDEFNPVIKTPQALESVHWRGAGVALAHASGVAWMDLWGSGWLKTPQIWKRAGRILDCLTRRMGVPLGDPDVVVFIDERALAYLVDPHAFQLLVQNVRESLLRSGLSAGFYLLSDLAHRKRFPEAKLYLFLNAWDIRPELRAAIKSRLQRDNKTLFWLYSAGLFDAGRDSLERAREVTGIALKPQPFHSKAGTTILKQKHPLCEAFPQREVQSAAKMEPSYFAIPENATLLGEYTATGLPSFVCRDFDGDGDPTLAWRSVFLGEPMVTPALIRTLGQIAGAHVWNFQEDVVHIRLPFVTVHCTGAGQRALAMPEKYAAYNLVSEQWVHPEGSSLRFQATDGSTHCFLIGLQSDIEAILQLDPAELLRMDELPPKTQETRMDSAIFDVPIMRMDEWIEGEGVEGIEEPDDWLFRPKLAEEQPEGESEKVGKRRNRRRGRRGDRGGSEETADKRPEGTSVVVGDEDGGMHVMFRKRE